MKKLIAFVLLLVSALCQIGCSSESASIGIIGGADGPTAIFLTSNINWQAIGAIVLIVLILLMIRRKKK